MKVSLRYILYVTIIMLSLYSVGLQMGTCDRSEVVASSFQNQPDGGNCEVSSDIMSDRFSDAVCRVGGNGNVNFVRVVSTSIPAFHAICSLYRNPYNTYPRIVLSHSEAILSCGTSQTHYYIYALRRIRI